MNPQSEDTSNFMDHETSRIKSASTSQEDYAHAIKLTNLTTQADQAVAAAGAPQVEVYSAGAQGDQNHYVPNQFQNMNSFETMGSNASGSGIILFPNLCQDDLKTKSGYSTEEDETISMNTNASTSSKATSCPYNHFNNTKRPHSDSDNNSMVVELSEDEMNLPKEKDISEKSHAKDAKDPITFSPWYRRRSSKSHFNSSIPKRARVSNSVTNFNEITSPPNSLERSLTQTRRIRKKKLQQQEDQASEEPSCSNNYQNRHSLHSNSKSSFIGNNPQGSFIEAPHISNNFNITVSQGGHDSNPLSALPYQAVDTNPQEFGAYKYMQPTPLPMYSNTPLLPAVRPSIWPVAPIYIPTNPHMFLAFGQPQQPQHPHLLLHQYPQPLQLPPSVPQMVNISPPMSAPLAMENLIGQSAATSSTPTPTSSTQSAGSMIRPESNWFRKELLCPPTQTGPDGQPIKVKAKRRPLPEWMAAAIENCNGAFVELNDAHMASTEQLYRMIVEEEFEFQRSKQ